MSAGQDTEESNGQATSPVMVSAALGDHFAQALKDLASKIPMGHGHVGIPNGQAAISPHIWSHAPQTQNQM
ncbi:hypothetical protein GE21DRAFT_1214611 [Neurospora crassa]|nr:hypothetical protein GE21DRAFT_1214611 [Neurospora crassa]